MSNERMDAMQAVVDRVSSYQESAPEGTVETELREAFAESDLEVSDHEVAALVSAIEAHGEVSVPDVLA